MLQFVGQAGSNDAASPVPPEAPSIGRGRGRSDGDHERRDFDRGRGERRGDSGRGRGRGAGRGRGGNWICPNVECVAGHECFCMG